MYTPELPELREEATHIAQTLSAKPDIPAPPTAAEIAQVTAWQRAVADQAALIRKIDKLISRLLSLDISASHNAELVPERDDVLAEVREVRALAFEQMRKLNPDQAWYWTEEWQHKEREADEDIAAGRVTSYSSGDDFLAALKARA
jgi:hypothetical protein